MALPWRSQERSCNSQEAHWEFREFLEHPWTAPGCFVEVPEGCWKGGSLDAPWGSLRIPGGPWRVEGSPLGPPRSPPCPESVLEVPGMSLEGPWGTRCSVFERIREAPGPLMKTLFSSVVQILAGTPVAAPLVLRPIVLLHGQNIA